MNKSLIRKLILLTVIFIAFGVTAVKILSDNKLIPSNITIWLYVSVVVAGGMALIRLFSNLVDENLYKAIGKGNANSLSFLIKLFGYIVLLIIVLLMLHVNLTSALFGGTIGGLIIGTASQNALSNVFSGISIFFSRPFKVGDRITISAWQYNFLLPYYAPKFFSKDLVVTGFTGKVEQISLMYTFIKTDEGILLKIPNDVVIKSAVLVHNAFESIVVRTKFEVPRSIKPDLLFSSLSKNLIDLDFIIGEPQYRVLDITPTSYIALVEIVAKGDSEESQRSKILQIAMRTLDSLIKKS